MTSVLNTLPEGVTCFHVHTHIPILPGPEPGKLGELLQLLQLLQLF